MIRSIALLSIFAFLFFLPVTAEAIFNIETDQQTLDFGLMAPNEVRDNVPSKGVMVKCTSDQGIPWRLRIRLESPLAHVNNPSETIASDHFWWYGANTTGIGTLVTNENDFTVERIVYSAPAGEGANGIDVELRFKLALPPRTQSGDYLTKIIFTLIE